MRMIDIPLLRPNPPRLTAMMPALEQIERSGIYANNGPTVRRLEQAVTSRLFGGKGGVVSTANATLALILAISQATRGLPKRRRLALMPSFTFAAAAQAAIWAGMKPLLCDIEPDRWTASEAAEEKLLALYGDRIGVIVPYATFGAEIDLDRYAALARRHDLQVVVDAASSLGSRRHDGLNFGAGSACTIVFSMHATKTFAAGEGGLIYSADAQRLAELRAMANFGFGQPRSATLPGLNAKLTEISALLALSKLDGIDAAVAHRLHLADIYRGELDDAFGFQAPGSGAQALQFMPVLLPPQLAPRRDEIIATLSRQGIGAATYFSPHLAEQPYLAGMCLAGGLAATKAIGARALSLPLSDLMTDREVLRVTAALRAACGLTAQGGLPPPFCHRPVRLPARPRANTLGG